MYIFHLILLVTVSMLTGCHTYIVPKEHVVMFDNDGTAVNPEGNLGPNRHMNLLLSYPRYSDAEYQGHIAKILEGINKGNTQGPKKIMMFIHGGMNTQFDSIERIATEYEQGKTRPQLMKEAGYYPIFVNWKSSLWSSYFEHLFYIRQGHRWPWYVGWPSSLVMFPVDVTRSLVRAPLVWSMQVYNDLTTIPLINSLFGPSLQDEVATELLCRYNGRDSLEGCTKQLQFQKPPYCGLFFAVEADPPAHRPPTSTPNHQTFPIAVGEDLRRCAEMTGHFFSYLATFPAKLAIGPVLDTFGTSAWDNMQRRIHFLFHKEEEMDDRNGNSEIIQTARQNHNLAMIEATGGLSVFLRALREHMKGEQWELVLVGHSMGTIVINELLRSFGDDQLPVTHIVFLAAAASIRDYEDSVWPFMRTHPQSKFHNFTLHPIEELSEIQYSLFDLPPRGTLLEWLDHFLADPITLKDRTVGRYDNFLKAMHDTPTELRPDIRPGLRPRINFRSFNAGQRVEKENPQTHSDAGERFRFWESQCWAVNAQLGECIKPK
ncbi:MAG: hypothetical protein H8K03_04490 [Nitrospira sp.]